MTKYIVKNCPCYELGNCNNEHIGDKYCQDCTDCPIKQVVEICKKYSCILSERWILASLILQTMQVQEVE